MNRRFVFIGMFFAIILIVVSLYFFSNWLFKSTELWLNEEAKNFGRVLCNSILESVKIPLEEDDDLSLNSMIFRIKEENSEIEEISIVRNSEIIAHTDPENLMKKFVLPEKAPFNLKTKTIDVKDDRVWIFKPVISDFGDTLGYIYIKLAPLSLQKGKTTLNRILWGGIMLFSALFLLFSFVLLFVYPSSETSGKSVSSPHYSDNIKDLIPESGIVQLPLWNITIWEERGEIPNIFYRVFKISPTKWGFLCFQSIGGGYIWVVYLNFVKNYLEKYIFVEDDPYVILNDIMKEVSKITCSDVILEGSIFFVNEEIKKIQGAVVGEHILFSYKDGILSPLYTASEPFDGSTGKWSIRNFESDLLDRYVMFTGNIIKSDKLKVIEEEFKKLLEEEESKDKILEELHFLYGNMKLRDGLLGLCIARKKEDEV